MWVLIGGLLTLLSGFKCGRETAFWVGSVWTVLVGVFGNLYDTQIPIDSQIMFFPEIEDEFIRRGGRKAFHRTLKVAGVVLVALSGLTVLGY